MLETLSQFILLFSNALKTSPLPALSFTQKWVNLRKDWVKGRSSSLPDSTIVRRGDKQPLNCIIQIALVESHPSVKSLADLLSCQCED